MPQTTRNAFAGGNSEEVIRRKTDEERTTTKLAYRDHSRVRNLSSRKWLGTPLKAEELYTGADLKRGTR